MPGSSERGGGVPTSVFLGTPRAAVAILEALTSVSEVVVAITRPDRAQGRSRRLGAPAVKEAAIGMGVAVAQPETRDELEHIIGEVAPDVAVVAAYGRLISPRLLGVPAHGFVNVHYSLLPRWRGASPVVRAVLAGDRETGVSLMQMDEGLDSGPVFATAGTAISDADTAGGLTERLAGIGADLLVAQLGRFLDGETVAVPQDDAMATAAAKVSTEEAHIDPLRHSADAVDRAVRAFDPKPGAWCYVDGQRLKIWKAKALDAGEASPGVAAPSGGRILVGTRTGAVELLVVQPAGRPVMDAVAWMNGRRGEPATLT